jgi:hypothetical protein
VKNIMQLAKAWNYTEVDENTVKVWEFELVWDEFEIAFVTDGESDNIESRFGMVIKMDLEITPELKIEWHARDIVRHIQEARKEAWYEVDDRISLNIVTSSRQNSEYLKSIVACYPIENETLSELDLWLTKWDIHKIIEVHDFTIDILLKK